MRAQVPLGPQKTPEVLIADFGELSVVVVRVELEEVSSELESTRKRRDENGLLSDPHQVWFLVYVNAQFLPHETDGLSRDIGLWILEAKTALWT